MEKITLTEQLAKECNYKSLRGLKMAISRKHGKGTYNSEMEIDIVKLVTVIAKKANTEVIERLLSNINTNVPDKMEDTETIIFDVKKELTESIRTNIKIGALANAFTGMKINKEELINKAITDKKNEYKERQDKLGKQIEKIQEQKEKIQEINSVFSEIGTNLHIIDFVKIDKKMYLTHTMYLCGNGYFRKLYEDNLDCLIIKDKMNMSFFDCYEDEKDKLNAIDVLENNKLYLMDVYDGNDEILDLTNIDDGIDYTKSEMEIILQLFSKRKLITSADCVDWIDFSTEDGKVDFSIKDEYVINIALANNGQDLYVPYDFNYGFSLESAKDLLKQMQYKNYKKIIDNVEYKIN